MAFKNLIALEMIISPERFPLTWHFLQQVLWKRVLIIPPSSLKFPIRADDVGMSGMPSRPSGSSLADSCS